MACVFVALGIKDANAQSLNFIQNAAGDHEFARHVVIPDGFGDGASGGPGGVWSIGAYPATATPSLLDGEWHQLTLVRRWPVTSGAELELWIDGTLVGRETSTLRTDMTFWWDSWPGFGSQAGWFWGSEKQAAIGILLQYEDYKGLIDELRFWSRAKSPSEIAQNFAASVNENEAGLVGRFAFEEGALARLGPRDRSGSRSGRGGARLAYAMELQATSSKDHQRER